MRQILITGTGRCGTGFMSQLFTSIGFNCTHEGIFLPRSDKINIEQWNARLNNPQWNYRAESSWLAAPLLKHIDLEDVIVIHIVRHPKKVIDSHIRIHAGVTKYNAWLHQHLPELDNQKLHNEFGIKYVKINKMIELYATYFHRIEDDSKILLNKMNLPYDKNHLFDNTKYNSRTGNRKSDVILKNFINKKELEQISGEYGYQW